MKAKAAAGVFFNSGYQTRSAAGLYYISQGAFWAAGRAGAASCCQNGAQRWINNIKAPPVMLLSSLPEGVEMFQVPFHVKTLK